MTNKIMWCNTRAPEVEDPKHARTWIFRAAVKLAATPSTRVHSRNNTKCNAIAIYKSQVQRHK